MDLYIVRARLKLMLWFVGVACAMGLLGSWYAWTQIDFGAGRETFLLSIVITGALAVAWIVLLIFFLSTRRVVLQGGVGQDHWWDDLPWWLLKSLALLAIIGIMAVVVSRLSAMVENEFSLMNAGKLERLAEKIIEEPALLERKERKSGKTLLELALESGQPEAVDVLLSNGAELSTVTNMPNHIVAALDNLPLLETLLKHDADPDAVDASDRTPLFYAVETRNTDALILLLEAGADANVRDLLDQTPLLVAIMADDIPVAEILVDHNAGLNLWDRAGETALHKAVRRRNLKSSRFLLESGADPKTFNLADMAPIHIAALNGQNELVELFLEQPDMLNLRNEGDRTAFDHALRGRKYDTVQLLLDHGYNIDHVMDHGYTAVHLMVIVRDYKAVKFLIEAGADVHVAGPEGETAYSLMKEKQLQPLLDLLELRDHPPGPGETNTVEPTVQP